MTYVYITTEPEGEDEDGLIGAFELPAIPRVGETIYVSYARRLYPNQEGRWTEDSIEHAKRFDGTRWVVVRVDWAASIDGDGRCDVIVKEAP